MEADMAFKKEGAEFTDTVRFKDYALSFTAEEASRFSNEDGDVASAKIDFALSNAASLSASKHTAKIKELRRFLKSKEIKDAAGNSGTGIKEGLPDEYHKEADYQGKETSSKENSRCQDAPGKGYGWERTWNGKGNRGCFSRWKFRSSPCDYRNS